MELLSEKKIKVYVECGTTLSSKVNTGIQRVVRSILNQSDAMIKKCDIEIVPVRLFSGRLVPEIYFMREIIRAPIKVVFLERCLRIVVRLSRHPLIKSSTFTPIKRLLAPLLRFLISIIQKYSYSYESIENQKSESDNLEILLLLDSTWTSSLWPAVDAFRATGGHVCAVLYDLIPFSHPETVEEMTHIAHTSWWRDAPLHVDSIMCISNTVRKDFLVWQGNQNLLKKIKPENIDFFLLGANLKKSDHVINVLDSLVPYYLMVGSLEPRKNHMYVMDAFDQLWKKNIDISLVFVGGNSWKSEILLERIRQHPQINRRLFLIQDASDRDLHMLYKESAAVIIASVAEGFGLPIIEAFKNQIQVFCSDIPVFREVAGNRATYFSLDSPEHLVEKIYLDVQENNYKILEKNTSDIKWPSWSESAEQLFSKVIFMASQPKRKL